MMRTLGTIDANTVVVTTVHDSQIVDIPEELVSLGSVFFFYFMSLCFPAASKVLFLPVILGWGEWGQ